MELKDMVISTLAELEETDKAETKQEDIYDEPKEELQIMNISEKQFYENTRERILVLFEGLKSPNNKNLESKIDLTLNFLEYLLARIDDRLENFHTAEK